MCNPTNENRANWAENAINNYCQETGDDDTETGMTDLLADMMHLCDRDGFDFSTSLARAEMHYLEEKEESK